MTATEHYSAETAFLSDIVGGVRNHIAMAHRTGAGADYEFTYAAPQGNRELLIRRLTTKLGDEGLAVAENASYIDDKVCYRVTLRGHAARMFRGFLSQHMSERHGVDGPVEATAPVINLGVVKHGPRAAALFSGIDGEVVKDDKGGIRFTFTHSIHTAYKDLSQLLGTDSGLTIAVNPATPSRVGVALTGEAAVKFIALENIYQQMGAGQQH